MSGIIGFIKTLAADRRGNTAIIFTLALLPIMLLVGSAVDLSGMHGKRTALQASLDAAALAAAKMPHNSSDAAVEDAAARFAAANFEGTITDFEVVRTEEAVTVSGKAPADLMFLSGFGFGDQQVSATSQATRGAHKIEVVMVLDNSGSMKGSKMSSLKTASQTLVDTLTTSDSDEDYTKIGLVPFTAGVNVGPGHKNDSWIDQDGRGSQHYMIFGGDNLNRFTAFDQVGQAWAGCVDTRRQPYDVEDTPPSIAAPDTLFQPYFAPDEPDAGTGYDNNYLDDWTPEPSEDTDTGPCAPYRGSWFYDYCINYYGTGDDDSDDDDSDEDEPWWVGKGNTSALDTAQHYYKKYKNSSFNGSSNQGPNYACLARPMQPLTDNFSDVKTAISNMKANGNTNIHQATAWGWRLLSPGAPFTEGAAYSDKKTKKFLILLTDGANNITHKGNHNKSIYSPYGYVTHGRFDGTPNTTYKIRKQLDARTAATCENAKAKGITVFTIAFDVSDDDIEDLMEGCASGSDRYYLSPSPGDLEETFNTIVNEITQLRLSQ